MLAAAHADLEAWATLAPLLARPLAAMIDVAPVVAISGDTARVVLWTGDWTLTLARRWSERIGRDAVTADEAKRVAAELVRLFKLIDFLADAQEGHAAVALSDLAVVWPKAEATHGLSDDARARVRDRLIGLYRVFNLPTADADDAAFKGEKRLALALVAQAFATATVEAAPAALVKAGQTDWAKRVAIESLIAAGL